MKGGDSPTGCYKCGRPGHWSRDCPDQNPTTANPDQSLFDNKNKKKVEEPKRVPKRRPKITPELMLSDEGIGFVLRHFPNAFRSRGRGREVSDLGNLIGLYADWHSQLIPYYSFDQFVNKVEQVGTTRRVKLCLGGLRDKVANGGDLTKLHDSPVEDNTNDKEEAINIEEPNIVHEDVFNEKHDTDVFEDDIFQAMYDQATETPNPTNIEVTGTTGSSSSHNSPTKDSTNETSKAIDDIANIAKQKQISDEQKARMEANRLKAMEKAAARARSTQVA